MSPINYVTYDPTGALTGAYQQEVQPEHLDCYIEVTEPQREDWTSYRANAARNGVELIPSTGIPSPVEVPLQVAALQFQLVLFDAGILDDADAYMQGQLRARLYWNRAQTYRRDSDWLPGLAGALAVSSDQVDAWFIAAS